MCVHHVKCRLSIRTCTVTDVWLPKVCTSINTKHGIEALRQIRWRALLDLRGRIVTTLITKHPDRAATLRCFGVICGVLVRGCLRHAEGCFPAFLGKSCTAILARPHWGWAFDCRHVYRSECAAVVQLVADFSCTTTAHTAQHSVRSRRYLIAFPHENVM